MSRYSQSKILNHVVIEKLGHGGIGIAHTPDAKTILVSGGVLPGSIIDVKILKSHKDYISAQCIHIHDIGKDYSLTTIKCPHYFFSHENNTHNHKVGCGGCKRQIVPYEQQLLLKQSIIIDTFHPLQDLINRIGIKDIIGSPQFFGYRNKIEYSFGKFIVGKQTESDRKQVGFYNTTPDYNYLLPTHLQQEGYHIITDLTPSRWAEYRALILESLKKEPHVFDKVFDDIVNDSDLGFLKKFTKKYHTCIEQQGKIFAFVSYKQKKDIYQIALGPLYISPQHRLKGLATILVTVALGYIKHIMPNTTSVTLGVVCNNIGAKKIYEKLGFTYTGETGTKKNNIVEKMIYYYPTNHIEPNTLNPSSHRNLGFHKQGLFSKIVDIDECFLSTPDSGILFRYLKKLLKQSGIPVYDQKMHTGFFRHLVIRQAINTDQFMINLVVKSPTHVTYADQEFDITTKRIQFKNALQTDSFLNKKIHTFLITTNDGLADIVKAEGTKTEILRGNGVIQEILQFEQDTVRFQISPFAFFQTNTHGAEVLFTQVMKLIGAYRGVLLDLYCGTGTIGLSLLKCGIGDEMIGIEIVADAIDDAWINADINNLKDKCYFVAGKAEKLIYNDIIINKKKGKIGLIIVDPPRDGLHPDVVSFLCNLRSKQSFKLLYISCNPMTLCRDIGLLKGFFDVEVLQPIDMFPHTQHCEMIATMK